MQRDMSQLRISRGVAPHLLRAGNRLLTWLPWWRQGDWPGRPRGLRLRLGSGQLHGALHLPTVLGQTARVAQLLLRLLLRQWLLAIRLLLRLLLLAVPGALHALLRRRQRRRLLLQLPSLLLHGRRPRQLLLLLQALRPWQRGLQLPQLLLRLRLRLRVLRPGLPRLAPAGLRLLDLLVLQLLVHALLLLRLALGGGALAALRKGSRRQMKPCTTITCVTPLDSSCTSHTMHSLEQFFGHRGTKRVSQHIMYITRQLEADNTQTLLLRSSQCPGQCSGPLPSSFERCIRRQHVMFSAQRIQEWTV